MIVGGGLVGGDLEGSDTDHVAGVRQREIARDQREQDAGREGYGRNLPRVQL